MTGSIPGKGKVAEPGLSGVAPGRGVISIPGFGLPPGIHYRAMLVPDNIVVHIHASGFIGSPTVPRSLRLDRSLFLGHSSPLLSRALIAVGAV